MTINELMIELSNYVQMGIDPDTPVIVRCEAYDAPVTDSYYCVESESVCLSID